MQYSKCGGPLKQGVKFCPYCGKSRSEIGIKINLSSEYPESERNTSEKNIAYQRSNRK